MGGGLHHVAFEPATCACDGLAEAIANGVAPILAPGQADRLDRDGQLHSTNSAEAGVA